MGVVFEEVKRQTTPKKIVTYYLGPPSKDGLTAFWKSPFRNEKSPSFAANDGKGITDFGSGESYDAISFVQKLHNVSPIEAAKIIIRDMCLNVNCNPFDEATRQSVVNIYDGLRKWRNKAYDRLCILYRATQEAKNLPPDSVGFFVACMLEGPLDEMTDTLNTGTEQEWLQLYRQLGRRWGE